MKNTKQTMAHTNHVLGGAPWKLKLGGLAAGAVLASLLLSGPVQAAAAVAGFNSASLAWDSSPSSGVAGYRVYMGTSSGNYSSSVLAANATATSIQGLVTGATYFFAVKAFDANGVESAFSNEVRFVPGGATLELSVTASGQAILTLKGVVGRSYDIQATADLRNWSVLGNVVVGSGGSASFTDIAAPSFLKRFYRARDLQP